MIVTLAALALVTPVAGALGHRRLRRTSAAKRLRITTPNGIDESGFVRIGGVEQWVQIRGEDLSNPVVVEIHGGPGASNLAFTPYTREWERHFTIVRWDMRGTGKTFGRGGPDRQGEMSLEQLQRDSLELVQQVRERIGVGQVVLVANSFGSLIGLRLARSHPELFSAYVGTDQNINAGGRENAAYHALVNTLSEKGKRKELAEITAMGADRTGWTAAQLAKFNKLVFSTDPLIMHTLKTVVLPSLWFSPLHSLRELRDGMRGQSYCEQIGPPSTHIDEWAEGTEFRIPFFVFQGARDALTPVEPARRFFDDVTAPVKGFGLIEDAGHLASFRHPERFLELMLAEVRPVVTGQRTADE
ncbi:alpha/beta hydrolase [Nocardia jejuensis]|uniref:alpha/beta hydrolase n=1 Tax=Nocardia jejuensis TaxID=328049 RepID=UPI0008297630|nr:alpha/beta hydrolase [Nocardia jejuensis]